MVVAVVYVWCACLCICVSKCACVYVCMCVCACVYACVCAWRILADVSVGAILGRNYVYRTNVIVECMCKYIYIYIYIWHARMVMCKDVPRVATGLRCRVMIAAFRRCRYVRGRTVLGEESTR